MKTLSIPTTIGLFIFIILSIEILNINAIPNTDHLDWAIEDLAHEICLSKIPKKSERWRCIEFEEAVLATYEREAEKFATASPKVKSIDEISTLAMTEPYISQCKWMLNKQLDEMITNNIKKSKDMEDRMMAIFIEWVVRVAFDKDCVLEPCPEKLDPKQTTTTSHTHFNFGDPNFNFIEETYHIWLELGTSLQVLIFIILILIIYPMFYACFCPVEKPKEE